MGCSCAKGKVNRSSYNAVAVSRSIAHTVKPGESCAFCAEKHISTAYVNTVNHNIVPQRRQLIIGELECARRHLFIDYNDQAKLVSDALAAVLLRKPDDEIRQLIATACTAVTDLATKIDNGEDNSTTLLYNSFTKAPADINPLIGELHFCTAWRSAMEIGYESINRSTVIGDLTMAQVHLHEFNRVAAVTLRNIRHLVQRYEYEEAIKEWMLLAYNMDVYITPDISNIKDTYGEDLSWYLSL